MDINVKSTVFTVDDTKSGPAFFVLSVRKSGSTMLNSAMRRLARINQLNFVDVGGTMFRNDIPAALWSKDEDLSAIIYPGNVYGGFRNFPTGMARHPLFIAGKKILLVRDPRDALVSEYFSTAYSHKVPDAESGAQGVRQRLLKQREVARETDVEEFVKERAPAMRRTIAEYKNLLSDQNTLLLKYETIIFNKDEMLTKIIRHFGWNCRPGQLKAILETIDVRPSEERPREFVRKVTPGDHLEKLSPNTITMINEQMKDVLGQFGYI
jgi:hypothetical protein